MQNYSQEIKMLNDKKVAIIIDNDAGGRTVTNDIDNIAKQLNVNYIIYQDTMHIWDFWSKDRGFATLALSGEATRDKDTAIAVAMRRYL